MVGFSNGRALALALVIVQPFENWNIQNPDVFVQFQMVSDIMAAICLDFKWLASRFQIPLKNWDHLQPKLFLAIRNSI